MTVDVGLTLFQFELKLCAGNPHSPQPDAQSQGIVFTLSGLEARACPVAKEAEAILPWVCLSNFSQQMGEGWGHSGVTPLVEPVLWGRDSAAAAGTPWPHFTHRGGTDFAQSLPTPDAFRRQLVGARRNFFQRGHEFLRMSQTGPHLEVAVGALKVFVDTLSWSHIFGHFSRFLLAELA